MLAHIDDLGLHVRVILIAVAYLERTHAICAAPHTGSLPRRHIERDRRGASLSVLRDRPDLVIGLFRIVGALKALGRKFRRDGTRSECQDFALRLLCAALLLVVVDVSDLRKGSPHLGRELAVLFARLARRSCPAGCTCAAARLRRFAA